MAVPLVSEKAGGLGLGLSIVRKLIDSYDGRIKFELVRPHGLRVSVTLPKTPEFVLNWKDSQEEKQHG